MSIITFCTVVYDGKGQPGPFERQFRLKGLTFESGKQVEITAEEAGMLIQSAPAGTVTVLKGEAVMKQLLSNSAKLAVKVAEESRKRFPVDPTHALDGIQPLSEGLRKVLEGKPADAVAYVEAGKADAELGAVAIWATLGGKAAIAKAAARRGEAVRTGAKPADKADKPDEKKGEE